MASEWDVFNIRLVSFLLLMPDMKRVAHLLGAWL